MNYKTFVQNHYPDVKAVLYRGGFYRAESTNGRKGTNSDEPIILGFGFTLNELWKNATLRTVKNMVNKPE